MTSGDPEVEFLAGMRRTLVIRSNLKGLDSGALSVYSVADAAPNEQH